MEEIDIKWNMALLSMRADRYWKKTGKKITIQGTDVARVEWDWSYIANDEENHALVADEEAPTEFALMAKTSAKSEVFDNSLCSKACKKNTDSLNSKITDLDDKLYDAKNMIYHYKLGLAQVEARQAEHRNQEVKYCEKIRILEFKTESRANCIKSLTKPASTIESSPDDAQNKNPFVNETKASPSTISPKPFIKFMKVTDRSTETKTTKVKNAKPVVKYAVIYSKPSKSSKVRGNQRNWNNQKSHQLGANFVMKKRACYNCGDFDHLAYDCCKWVEHGRSWAKNNNTHKSMSPRPAIHKLNRPPIRPVRPNMNVAQLKRTSFHKPAHSYNKRPFQSTSAV
nr:ubiquitin hydrolase [Tanacetum cinerariifolium]